MLARCLNRRLLADFIPWISLGVMHLLLAVPIEISTKISAVVLVIGALIAVVGTLARSKPVSDVDVGCRDGEI